MQISLRFCGPGFWGIQLGLCGAWAEQSKAKLFRSSACPRACRRGRQLSLEEQGLAWPRVCRQKWPHLTSASGLNPSVAGDSPDSSGRTLRSMILCCKKYFPLLSMQCFPLIRRKINSFLQPWMFFVFLITGALIVSPERKSKVLLHLTNSAAVTQCCFHTTSQACQDTLEPV